MPAAIAADAPANTLAAAPAVALSNPRAHGVVTEQRDSDPDAGVGDGIDPWRAALAAGDAERLRALVDEQGGRAPRGARGESILHFATSYLRTENRARMVEVLLDGGMSVDGRDQSGATPLHWAAGYVCAECITLLLAAGAEVNAARKDGRTPLHRARAAAATLLLAAGADVRARDRFGRVPLHTAFEAIPSLLPAGVNALDDHGMTPLHLAALPGNIDQVEWLHT